VKVDQLALDEPSAPDLVRSMHAWEDNYPWLCRAIEEIGPGARAASARWRLRIEDELKTTLDFKVRPDGTAAVWCGMSGYDFHHDPTPKELFEGLAEAYRREIKRRRKPLSNQRPGTKSSACAGRQQWPKPHVPPRASPPPTHDSLTRALGAVLLPRMEQLTLIFLGAVALTFALSTVAFLTAH
jgi:hypothetical protein